MSSVIDVNTADLFDAHEMRCASCATQFRQFGGRRSFYGPIRTVFCRGDNALAKQTLRESSKGGVLVIDAGGEFSAAVVGDVLAGSGVDSGWSGIIINGVVRDSAQLVALDIGIKALGTNPKKSAKLGTGQVDVAVTFGGVTFNPGDWLYSDDDGILVSSTPLH